jgi:hypothetical protein
MKVLWDGLWREGNAGTVARFSARQHAPAWKPPSKIFSWRKSSLRPIETEDRMRRRIEGAIAKQVRKDKVASSLLPPDIRVLGRLTTETPLPIRIVTPVKILGLPEQLDV